MSDSKEVILFKIGDVGKAVNIAPLPGNEVAPPLEMGTDYTVKGVFIDGKGNQHLDVGLESKYSYITSYETQEKLPDGDKIHWCHPSRLQLQ